MCLRQGKGSSRSTPGSSACGKPSTAILLLGTISANRHDSRGKRRFPRRWKQSGILWLVDVLTLNLEFGDNYSLMVDDHNCSPHELWSFAQVKGTKWAIYRAFEGLHGGDHWIQP